MSLTSPVFTIKCRSDKSSKSAIETFRIGFWLRRLVKNHYKSLGNPIQEPHFCLCIDVDFSLDQTENGCAIYRITDGDLSIRAIFTAEALENNFDSQNSTEDSQERPVADLSKSVILLETFSLLHGDVSGMMCGDFVLKVFSFVWQPYSRSNNMVNEMLHRAPQYIWCYDDPFLQPLVKECHERKRMFFFKPAESEWNIPEEIIPLEIPRATSPPVLEISPPVTPPTDMPPLEAESPSSQRDPTKLHPISINSNLSECLDLLYKSQTAKGLLIPLDSNDWNICNQKTTAAEASNESMISSQSQPHGLTPVSGACSSSSRLNIELLVLEGESNQDEPGMPEGFALTLGSSDSSLQSSDRLQLSSTSPEVITISDDDNSQNVGINSAKTVSKTEQDQFWPQQKINYKALFSGCNFQPYVILKRLSLFEIKTFLSPKKKAPPRKSLKNKVRTMKWVPRTGKKNRTNNTPKKTTKNVVAKGNGPSTVPKHVSPTCLEIMKQLRLSGNYKFDHVLGNRLTESQISLPLTDSLEVQTSQGSITISLDMSQKKINGSVPINKTFTSLKAKPKKSTPAPSKASTVFQSEFSNWLNMQNSETHQPKQPFIRSEFRSQSLLVCATPNSVQKFPVPAPNPSQKKRISETNLNGVRSSQTTVFSSDKSRKRTSTSKQAVRVINLEDSDEEPIVPKKKRSTSPFNTNTQLNISSALPTLTSNNQRDSMSVHSRKCHSKSPPVRKGINIPGFPNHFRGSGNLKVNCGSSGADKNKSDNVNSFYSAVVNKMRNIQSVQHKPVKRKLPSGMECNKKRFKNNFPSYVPHEHVTELSSKGVSCEKPAESVGSSSHLREKPVGSDGHSSALCEKPAESNGHSPAVHEKPAELGYSSALDEKLAESHRGSLILHQAKTSGQGNQQRHVNHLDLSDSKCSNFLSHEFGGTRKYPDSWLAAAWNHFFDSHKT